MRIYAACLASYNNGVLHGRWIDVDHGDADTVREEIAAILRESKFPNVTVACPECGGTGVADGCCTDCNGTGQVRSAEEYAIHDYDGIPSSWGEHLDLDKLCAYAEVVADLDESDREAFDAWLDVQGSNPGDLDDFREQYQGCHSTLTDWAESWHDDVGTLRDIPDEVARYFDFESWGRDAKLGGDIWTHDGEHGVHVFNNH